MQRSISEEIHEISTLHQTDAEHLLWKHLRDRRLENCKFRRQVSLGDYIVDFVSFETGLIIEVDESQHLVQQKKMNQELDGYNRRGLRHCGSGIMRF